MRALIALGALAAVTFIAAPAPRAEAADWCYDGEQGQTCGFISLQQCLDALSATAVGTCLYNPQDSNREVVRTQPRKRTAH